MTAIASSSCSIVDEWGFKYPFNFDEISVVQTSSNISFLRETLNSSLLFSSFINKNKSTATDIIIKAFDGFKVSKGQMVIKEGCKNPAYIYIIEKGRISVNKTGGGNMSHHSVKMSQELLPGCMFGDMAFIHNCPRNSTLIVEEDDTIIWRMHGILFCKIFTCQMSIFDVERYSFFTSLTLDNQILRNTLTANAIYKQYQRLKSAEYTDGQIINFAGSSNLAYIHIVYRGTVLVKPTSSSSGVKEGDDIMGNNDVTTVLKPGDSFGYDDCVSYSSKTAHVDLDVTEITTSSNSTQSTDDKKDNPNTNDNNNNNNKKGEEDFIYIAHGQVKCLLLSHDYYRKYTLAHNNNNNNNNIDHSEKSIKFESAKFFDKDDENTTAVVSEKSDYDFALVDNLAEDSSKSSSGTSGGNGGHSIMNSARSTNSTTSSNFYRVNNPPLSSSCSSSSSSSSTSTSTSTNTSNSRQDGTHSYTLSSSNSTRSIKGSSSNTNTTGSTNIGLHSILSSAHNHDRSSGGVNSEVNSNKLNSTTTSTATTTTNADGDIIYTLSPPPRPTTKDRKKVEISMDPLTLRLDTDTMHSYRSSLSTARSMHSDRGSVNSDRNSARSVKSTARSVNFNDFEYPSLKSARALEFLEHCKESSQNILDGGNSINTATPSVTSTNSRKSRKSGSDSRSSRANSQTPRTPKNDHNFYQNLELSDCQLIKVLGIGGFGKVRLARIYATGELIVLKTQSKEKIVAKSMESIIINEIQLMRMMDHPFIARLYCAFQDKCSIHMAIELLQGGDLFGLLKREGKNFSEEKAVFYAGMIVLALEALHKEKIAYRDLKPENLVLDHKGFLKVIDFGLAKKIKSGGVTRTLCGTPDYMAPEIVEDKGHSYPVDWWALGALIYEMVDGFPPFYHENEMKVYKKIMNCDYKFNDSCGFSNDLKDFIHKLLVKDPTKRLGYSTTTGITEVQKHPWFVHINWKALLKCNVDPPYIPVLRNNLDTSHFDDYPDDDNNGDNTNKEGNETDWVADLNLTKSEVLRSQLTQLNEVWSNKLQFHMQPLNNTLLTKNRAFSRSFDLALDLAGTEYERQSSISMLSLTDLMSNDTMRTGEFSPSKQPSSSYTITSSSSTTTSTANSALSTERDKGRESIPITARTNTSNTNTNNNYNNSNNPFFKTMPPLPQLSQSNSPHSLTIHNNSNNNTSSSSSSSSSSNSSSSMSRTTVNSPVSPPPERILQPRMQRRWSTTGALMINAQVSLMYAESLAEVMNNKQQPSSSLSSSAEVDDDDDDDYYYDDDEDEYDEDEEKEEEERLKTSLSQTKTIHFCASNKSKEQDYDSAEDDDDDDDDENNSIH